MLKTITKKYAIILLSVFAIFWIIMAFDVRERYMWFVENVLMFIFVVTVIFTFKRFRFSALSYTLFFIFLILQTIGAHYTYEYVPFEWTKDLFDTARNNYDRLVHFSYGFLLAVPIREWYLHYTKMTKNFLSYWIPVEWALATGAIYELIEWLFAVFSGEGNGNAFLGSQGDVWDAHWDMALAGIGATIAMILFKIFLSKKEQNVKK
jgi:putative membrane protein